MTQTNAVATSPVLFFTDDGRLIQIPISTIKFTGDDVNTTLPADASTTKLHAYLQYLAKIGEIVREAAPPPVTALVATAIAPGPIGNRITIAVEPSTDPTKVDITVTQIDTYVGLKLSTIESIVGSVTTPASAPGLFRVKTISGGPQPPGPASYAVDHDAAGTALDTWTISNTPAPALLVLEPILKAAASGYTPDDFKVVVSDVSTGTTAADTTFTLTITWSHTIENIAAPATATTGLPAAFAELRYLASFTPTTGWKLPRPGTTTLVGGRAATTAQSATTTLLANA